MLYNCYIMYELITCFLLRSFVLLVLFILLYRVYKKVDNIETAFNLAKRLEVSSFFISIHFLGTYGVE